MSLLNVDVTQLLRVSNEIAGMAARANNELALLGDVGHLMIRREIPAVFAAQGIPRWPEKGPMAVPGRILDLTGRQRQSQGYQVHGSTLIVGTGTPGGGTHQEGKRIRARNATYMAIPFPELYPAEYRLPPRAFANTFVRTSARGNKVIWQRTGPGPGNIRRLFLLKRSVKIRRRVILSWREAFISECSGRMIHFIYQADFPSPAGIKPGNDGFFDAGIGWAA